MEHAIGRGRVSVMPGAYADLLRENEHLRATVATAEYTASRHAIMLREGDHRIKNSLQIISALMNMQARQETSASAAASIRTAASRIHSIARIHDCLQQGGGADEVDLADVLRSMCAAMQDMASEASGITIKVTAGPIPVSVAIAQPLVLAVNELVINALRHGFPGGGAGLIEVTAAERDGELYLTVADDGVGLPVDYAEGAGYGMKLVRMMVEQVSGQLHAANRGGAAFMMAVPLSNGAILPIETRAMVSA